MIRIKKLIKRITVLCALLACFSCQKEVFLIDIIDTFLIELSGKPDKVIKNTHGNLYYDPVLNVWGIIYGIPGTHDSADIYIIAKMPDRKFSFEERKEVMVSGSCYRIPWQKLAEKGRELLAGTECYYIEVTNIKYQEK